MKLIDTNVEFLDGDDSNPLVIKKTQEITSDFLDSLKADRDASDNRRMGEFERVASIPVIIHEQWLKQGYDMSKEPLAKTLAKLKTEGLDYFITTNKRIA